MKTIADYKREIRMKQGLKKDPVSAISEILEHQNGMGNIFNDVLKEAMSRVSEQTIKDLLIKVKEQATKEILGNEKLLLAIAQEAANRVRTPEDGHTPKKGEDYFDGLEGRTPIKGEDYFTESDIEEIAEKTAEKVFVNDGHTPIKGLDYFTEEEVNSIIEKSTQSLTGEKIVDEVNVLPIEPKYQIDAKHIKNLPKNNAREGTGLARGGGGYWKESGDTISPLKTSFATVVNPHESTGLVPQVMNGGYCAIGDLPDVATVPEGTYFFIIP